MSGALVLGTAVAHGPTTFPLTVKVAPGGLAVPIFDHFEPAGGAPHEETLPVDIDHLVLLRVRPRP